MFTKYCLSEALRCKKWEQRRPLLFPGLWSPMDDISSSLLFLLSHIFSGVEFLELINFIKFTRMRESVGEKRAWETGQFFCLFVSEDCGGSHHFFNRERTNTECPRSLLFRNSYCGSVEMAWLCLLVSGGGCFQLLVIGLLLGSREDGPCPFTLAWGVGWSRNYTTLSKHLTLPSPLSLTPQILKLQALDLLGKEESQILHPPPPPQPHTPSGILCMDAICCLRGGLWPLGEFCCKYSIASTFQSNSMCSSCSR